MAIDDDVTPERLDVCVAAAVHARQATESLLRDAWTANA
jgi:hypothetical protein